MKTRSHQRTEANTDPMVGELAGEYRLVERLGSGPTGVVYEGWATSGQVVAIKVLDPSLALDPAYVERMVKETRAVAQLRHPGIAVIHDVGVIHGDRPYMVMERLEGQTLTAWAAAKGKLTIDQVRSLGVQLCGALAAAHARNLVHRDLKPENVFVVSTEQGPKLKLLDFGISTLTASPSTPGTPPAEFVGTPSVMSPEQIRNERISPRADLYALGALLYRLLTGADPFQASTPAEVLIQHLSKPAPDPRTKRADIPEPLAKLVLSLLAKDPGSRPASADVVERTLRAPLPAPRPSRPAVALGDDSQATELYLAPVQAPAPELELDDATEPTTVIPNSQKPAPAKPAAASSAPSRPAPSKPARSRSAPSKSTPSTPAPSRPAPSRPAPAEPALAEPALAEPVPAQPLPAEESIWADESSVSKPSGMRTLDGLIPKIANPRPARRSEDDDEAPPRKRWPLVVGALLLAGAAATFGLTRSRDAAPAPVPVPVPVPAAVAETPKEEAPAPLEKKPARKRPPGPLTARGLQARADTLKDELKERAPNTTYDARVELRKLRRRAEAKPDAAELEAISDALDAWEDYYLPPEK